MLNGFLVSTFSGFQELLFIGSRSCVYVRCCSCVCLCLRSRWLVCVRSSSSRVREYVFDLAWDQSRQSQRRRHSLGLVVFMAYKHLSCVVCLLFVAFSLSCSCRSFRIAGPLYGLCYRVSLSLWWGCEHVIFASYFSIKH